jgi:hypothetical protein
MYEVSRQRNGFMFKGTMFTKHLMPEVETTIHPGKVRHCSSSQPALHPSRTETIIAPLLNTQISHSFNEIKGCLLFHIFSQCSRPVCE